MHNILVDRVGNNVPKLEFKRLERVVDRSPKTYKNSSFGASRCVSCEREGRQSCPENLSKTRVLAPRHAFRMRGSSIGFRKRTKNRVLVLERSKFIFFLILLFVF